MEMRIVVPDAAGATSLAEHLATRALVAVGCGRDVAVIDEA